MRHTRKARRHIRNTIEHKKLPYGVRVLAWMRAIRWIGWGLGEALLPVFILSFSHTFAEAGLFSSTVDIASLVSLPLIGAWADRASSKRLILISLLLYPLVGVSYFFAGALGMAIFVVIARIVNGVTWEFENIGVETYYRRTVDASHVATSFGYIDMWSHFAWISASLVGMFLVVFMPIHVLLLGIAPFALISYVVLMRAPADAPPQSSTRAVKRSIAKMYKRMVTSWKDWDSKLQLLAVLVFFASILEALMYFFVPIDAYISGSSLSLVILLTVFGSVPSLFGYKLGRVADAENKYALVAGGLLGVGALLAGLALVPYYWFKLVAIFLMGLILELFFVIEGSLVTTLGPAETYGERGSVFEAIITLGDLASPPLIGIAFDMIGFSGTTAVMAVGAVCLAGAYIFISRTRRVATPISRGGVPTEIVEELPR
ncbi:MAG: MFS transporter [Patescibacteria group bacterium]|nr:MFS transporter [Patescibacteria group bacterium]MDE2116396.1 MFS transporter [Patescibacteria group bacterium]